MKPIRIAWCLAAAALVLGCERTTEPVAEGEAVDVPAFKAEHVNYMQEYYWNDIMHYSCLGEDVWERGRILAYKGRVFQPNGNANRWTWDLEFYGLLPEDPDYAGDEYTLLGLTSGDLWTFERATKPAGRRHDKKDGFKYHGAHNIWFRNQDGERLHYQESYTLHCDYSWENCTLEQSRGSCPTEWIDYGPPS
jgi:hypothetical protein